MKPNEHSVILTKKEIILKTSLQLLVKQGIQETPISQISKESGVAVGTIYHHFESKIDIINTLFLELKKEYAEALIANTENLLTDKTDTKAVFTIVWNNIFNYYINNENKFRFLVHIGSLPIITPKNVIEGIKGHDPIIKHIKASIKNNIYKPVSIRLISETIHSNIVVLVELALQNSIKLNKKIINQAIEMSWDSIAQKNKKDYKLLN